MRWFKLTLTYDGTHFAGWQWQPSQRTVQATLEEMLQRVTGQFSRVVASSRTDAGVHALGQVVSFTSSTQLAPRDLMRALNAYAPEDIRVLEVAPAADRFHATRDAVAKRYRYVVQDGQFRDVFARHYAWHIWQRLDVAAMQRAALCLEGTHDFASFQTSGSPRVKTTRTVFEVSVRRSEREPCPVEVEVEADGFLYNMVRNFVGTLVAVGKQQRSEAWVREVLHARDRRMAGMTVPPQGLFLLWVRHREPPREASVEGPWADSTLAED